MLKNNKNIFFIEKYYSKLTLNYVKGIFWNNSLLFGIMSI